MENVGLAQRLGGDRGVCQVGSRRGAFRMEKGFRTLDSAAQAECLRANEAGAATRVSTGAQDRKEDGRGPGSHLGPSKLPSPSGLFLGVKWRSPVGL